jgi:hypothetical protein
MPTISTQGEGRGYCLLAVTTFLGGFCGGEANVTPLYSGSGSGDLSTCTNKLAFGTLPKFAAAAPGEPNKGAVPKLGDILTISMMGGGLGLGLHPLVLFLKTIFITNLDFASLVEVWESWLSLDESRKGGCDG